MSSSRTSEYAAVDCTAAEVNFLVPVLTNELYNSLVVDNANGSLSQKQQQLVKLAKGAAANLAYFEALPILQVNFSEKGITSKETDDHAPLHKWEYNKVADFLQSAGYLYLEQMIEYLVANAEYLNWQNEAITKTFFATGASFNKYFTLAKPHVMFPKLKTVIAEGAMKLAETIGEETVNALINGPEENEDNVVKQKFDCAIVLAKRFIVFYTINKSIERFSVAMTEYGFTVIGGTDQADLSFAGNVNAPASQLSLLHNSTRKDAERYLSSLRAYLNNNASEELFADYFNSSYYTSAEVSQATRSANENSSIFRF